MTPNTRTLLIAGSLLGIALLVPPFVFYESTPFSRSPTILFVGDAHTPESYGSQVLAGINKAKRPEQNAEIPVVVVDIGEPIDYARSRDASEATMSEYKALLYAQMAHEFAAYNIVAIVAANTSATASMVLDAAKVYNVPVLLAVATNDRVLSGHETRAFRLPPNDSVQAKAIANWCREHKSTESAIGVLLNPMAYGADLYNKIASEFGLFEIIPFLINATDDDLQVLRALPSVRTWLVLGYRNEAREVIVKRQMAPEQKNSSVLLSDGAYGQWLASVTDSAVSIAFPGVSSTRNTTESTGLIGYETFGYDAYKLLVGAIRQVASTAHQKSELFSAIAKVTDNNLYHGYSFAKGENTQASFEIYPVAASPSMWR